MARISILTPCAFLFALLITLSPLQAAESLDRVLPASTKGFVSFPDIDRAIERWNSTDLGELMNQPAMQPFVDELSRTFQGDFLKLGERLGVQIGQLRELRAGEVGLALIQPGEGEHAAVLLVDVRGREQAATAMIADIATDVEQRGGRRDVTRAAGAEATTLTLPGEAARQAHYVLRDSRLVITDHAAVAADVVRAIDGSTPGLGDATPYQRVMKSTRLEHADVRWFIEPFGLVEVLRAANPQRHRASTDIVKVLSNQGFRAIEAAGGQIRLATDAHEVLHRTKIYAPGNLEGTRFALAARMLSFPNSKQMAPLDWIPANVTSHITLRWDLRNAFEYSKTLVNEYAGEQVFDEILANIETDENGPQINIRRELVAHLGDRISILADIAKPIDADSERIAFAIELTDAKSVSESLDRAMQHDPKAVVHQVGEFHIWEMGGAEEEDEEIIVMIDDPFSGNPFGPSIGGEEEAVVEEEEEDEELLSNLCFTVAHGQLLVSKKLDLLTQILVRQDGDASLSGTTDFATVEQTLRSLGAGNDSCRVFVRTAQAYEPTYEMLRAGRMPESNSLLGRVLNALSSTDGDEEALRQQRIDGGTMPAFSEIRKYLGPAGMFMTTTEDGWVLTGCLLKSEGE